MFDDPPLVFQVFVTQFVSAWLVPRYLPLNGSPIRYSVSLGFPVVGMRIRNDMSESLFVVSSTDVFSASLPLVARTLKFAVTAASAAHMDSQMLVSKTNGRTNAR